MWRDDLDRGRWLSGMSFVGGQLARGWSTLTQRVLLSFHAVTSPAFLRGLGIFLLGLGFALRAKHYFENRSLWLDEAWVGVTVVSCYFSELWQNMLVLPEVATPPLFFLLIEKSIVWLWGNHEYALRLFPFVAGLTSVVLFYFLTRRILSNGAATLALAVFVLSEPLVYYSAELKQYSTDVLVALLLYLFLERISYSRVTVCQASGLAIVGAVAVWFSNAAVFILAGVMVALFVGCWQRPEWKRFFVLAGVTVAWTASSVILYDQFLKGAVDDPQLLGHWKNTLLTAPLWSIKGMFWIKGVVWAFFNHPVGLSFSFWCFCLFLIGAVRLWRQNPERCLALGLPILATLGASFFHWYPFRGRLLLFLAPAGMIFWAAGVLHISELTRKLKPIVFMGLSILFLAPMVKTEIFYLFHSREKEENRVVMQFLKQNMRPGDHVVTNNEGKYQFWYYTMSLGIDHRVGDLTPGLLDGKIIIGYQVGQFLDFLAKDKGLPVAFFQYRLHVYNKEGHLRKFLGDQENGQVYRVYPGTPLDFIKGRRVWFVFSRMDPLAQSFVLWKLDRQAKKVTGIVRKGAAAYLYDFGP